MKNDSTLPQSLLIVDDDDGIRQVASLALTRVGGFNVTSVPSGAKAIAYIQTNTVDVIILDVMMPLMDGPTTLEEIRRLENARHTPVIFLTAKALPSELEKLSRLGVIGVLTKPFDPMTLSLQIRELLEKADL